MMSAELKKLWLLAWEGWGTSLSGLWKVVKSPDHWSGLFPTVLLCIVAYFALQKTNDQIKLTSEQMGYLRQPILFFEAQPTREAPLYQLFLSNVGNESAENVTLRSFLLLVTDSQIFSYGQYQEHRAYFADTTRTAKEMIWPRLTLHPDSRMEVTTRVISEIFLAPYQAIPRGGDSILKKDFLTIRDSLGGGYVLFVESIYRRPIDLKRAADTSWFSFDPTFGPSMGPLEQQVGGPGIIERCKSYLEHGPQLSINIVDNAYVIYRHTASLIPKTVREIPRPTFK